MMRWLHRRLAADDRSDAGASVVTVLLTFLALFALVLTTMEYAANSARPAAADVQWERAGSAAQSGLADYFSRLRANSEYWESVDCKNAALVGQDAAVMPNKCDWPAGAVGWAPVEPGADPATTPAYHYELTRAAVERYNRATSISVAVTGRSAGKYRTLQVQFSRPSSADYVNSTDFWLMDPALWKETESAASLSDECGGSTVELTRYYAQRTAACPNANTYVAPGSSFEGDVLINDAARFDGGVVDGQYWTAHEPCREATADPSTWMSKCLQGASGYSGNHTFSEIKPLYTTPRTLQDGMKSLPGAPGCHYYGATRIVLEGSSGMRVWSRDTAATTATGYPPLAVADSSGVKPDCGDPATLASEAGQRVPVPNGMVVYVGDVPSWIRAVPNEPLAAKSIGGNESYGYLPIGDYDGAAPATTAATTTIDPDIMTARKYRPMGNLYLEGTLDGFATFVAEGSVIATGDIVLAGGMSGDDMAGIVAGHSVEIYRPVVRTVTATPTVLGPAWNFGAQLTTSTPLSWAGNRSGFTGTNGEFPHRYRDSDRGTNYPVNGLQIQAAVQALGHSMYVQQYWTSAQGVVPGRLLVIQGSVGTRYSGALGTSANLGYGYVATRRYDPRLVSRTPPYLPLFTGATWGVGPVGEIATPDATRPGT